MPLIRRHPIVSFFVLAYALTWAAVPWGTFFPPGALIAAIIVVAVTDGVPGLKNLGASLIRWRVNWIWYVLALGVPLLIHGIATSANLALGANAPTADLLNPWYGIPLAISLNMINPTGGPLSEEPSFRGYAQPNLQIGRTRLAATAIMAVLIAGWHLPLVLLSSFALHPIDLAATVAVTFWYAWLFNRASCSVLLTLIAHATEGAIRPSDPWTSGADADRQVWLYALTWCALSLVLLVADHSFWTLPAAAVSAPTSPRPSTVPSATRA